MTRRTAAYRATVVVPTHDHGQMLRYSVGSAMAQTVSELEIFIVGDGVPTTALPVIEELVQRDGRIRFFNNKKGLRHGELSRHTALTEASGGIVCYLSDDDLWLPGHVETLERLLQDADFAHTLPFAVAPDQQVYAAAVDLELPDIRRRLLDGTGLVNLSTAGHTLEAYRRLPFGWRTTPTGTPTDLYMWQQFLGSADCRALSSPLITTLSFPSPSRKAWSAERRVDELARWTEAMTAKAFLPQLTQQGLEFFVRECLRQLSVAGDRDRVIESLTASVTEQIALVAESDKAIEALRVALTDSEHREQVDQAALADREAAHRRQVEESERLTMRLFAELEEAQAARMASCSEAAALRATVTWRLHDRFVALALVRRAMALRAAAKARARR
jgi:hypothetical protein